MWENRKLDHVQFCWHSAAFAGVWGGAKGDLQVAIRRDVTVTSRLNKNSAKLVHHDAGTWSIQEIRSLQQIAFFLFCLRNDPTPYHHHPSKDELIGLLMYLQNVGSFKDSFITQDRNEQF